MIKSLLFVCTGNTCRSSMAETLLKRIKKSSKSFPANSENFDLYISSAGVSAQEGEGANPKAIKAMEEFGLDLTYHKARQITGEMIEESDLILVMTQGQKAFLTLLYPASMDKVFTLKEYVDAGDSSGNHMDVLDPFGGTMDDYRKSALEIKRLAHSLAHKLGIF